MKAKIVKFLFLLFIVLVSLVLYARFIGTSGITIKEYRIKNEKITSNFSGIKIVHLSDIYYQNTIKKTDLDKIAIRINELKPDIIIFSGNLYTNNKKISNRETKELKEFLLSLKSTLGKYAVYGSSDYKINYEEILMESDFILLNNSYDLIYNNDLNHIFIGGIPAMSKEISDLDKLFEYYKIENELKDNSDYKIIVSSEGNVFDKVIKYGIKIDLCLGASSLNGSVIVPFYGPLYIPKNTSKYYAPHYMEKEYEIFITSGIGTDKFKFRFNNKPSFNLYRLKSI